MSNSIKDTRVVMSQVMLPNQANIAGNIHGGEIMKFMDSVAYVAAKKYARSNIVTARVDELQFHLPIFIGALVTCTAEIAFVGKSSMEVSVTVEVEDLEKSIPPQKALSAYFTMVALDNEGKPKTVPKLVLSTEEEKMMFEEGKKRYESYKLKRNK
ncbi:acyl-CoA thioesterase [Anaeromicrobium sediminis]|uniref:Acyl-CoA thioesterase n=1 Tax=Anaeromicrobium sediminis TaxID=1478221 RepID=A0A267MNL4_9FIRM|nr:acyl-CoA thioesterase [Anaeromicrobium sediminis]PAB61184.1 acyl-CoA thioesterase [Anaeromicrobium sediminis]